MADVDVLLTHAKLLTSRGIVDGALRISRGRIVAIRSGLSGGSNTRNLRGGYVAPGFIDLHLWGEPAALSRELARHGTTAFLTTLGPEPTQQLARDIIMRRASFGSGLRAQGPGQWPQAQSPQPRTAPGIEGGATCLGFHLEGPFLNPVRGGALPKRWMRAPSVSEMERLWTASGKRLKLVTMAPELPGAREAIRWCVRRGIVVSLGHSDADAQTAERAVDAGATAVTHAFNGMRSFHHRQPSLIDIALLEPRLTAMAIVDGVHISPSAFRLLVASKGSARVALVSDSVRRAGWDVVERNGALYRRDGALAGSRLTMIDAVRNAVRLGSVSLIDAVRMATEVPAALLNDHSRGQLTVGRRADLTVFDRKFRILLTIIDGHIAYERN